MPYHTDTGDSQQLHPVQKYSPHKKVEWNDKLHLVQQATQKTYKIWKTAGNPEDSHMHNHYKFLKKKFIVSYDNIKGENMRFILLPRPTKLFCMTGRWMINKQFPLLI